MKLEQRIKDWKELKRLMEATREKYPREVRVNALNKFYEEIRKYYNTYHIKFDPLNIPK